VLAGPVTAEPLPEPPTARSDKISFAPVLATTLSRDSCSIIRWTPVVEPVLGRCRALPNGWWAGGLLGLLDDLENPPVLGGAQRSRLHDPHEVAHAGLIGLVVRLDLAGAADDLAVQAVLDAVLDLDDDGLVHLVGHDVAAADLALLAHRRGGLFGVLAHGLVHFSLLGAVRMPSSRSCTIV